MIDQNNQAITAIMVRGFKSLAEESTIEIRPLTILAGANSSGKSSIMQPLLLLKQTLEAPYDPGPLLLDGPNVCFTLVDQFLSRLPGKPKVDGFTVKIELVNEVKGSQSVTNLFKKMPTLGIDLVEMKYQDGKKIFISRPEMTHSQIVEQITQSNWLASEMFLAGYKILSWQWRVIRNRCFLELDLPNGIPPSITASNFYQIIKQVIHIPGLRGNPERAYKATHVSDQFMGTFEHYVASIIHHWQINHSEQLATLARHLEILGLALAVKTQKIDDTRIEIQLGQWPSQQEMVSVADVGFGVSQTLPVLVALLVAKPGQLVYLEQPEIHLHPRAQVALATILAEAAARGVRVVAETHSALLLLAIQALVAEGKFPADKAILHWFTRDSGGLSKISSANLDQAGAFGDWPEDFGEVDLALQSRYLDAAEAQLGI